jgi:hypothetical protein
MPAERTIARRNPVRSVRVLFVSAIYVPDVFSPLSVTSAVI